MTYHAVFAIAPTSEGGFAATTRAADRGEQGRIGLPGGKVDAGEDPRQALIREAWEEGWFVNFVALAPCHVDTVEGNLVAWYRAERAFRIKDGSHKEAGRVEPIVATRCQVLASGYGNDRLPI